MVKTMANSSSHVLMQSCSLMSYCIKLRIKTHCIDTFSSKKKSSVLCIINVLCVKPANVTDFISCEFAE